MGLGIFNHLFNIVFVETAGSSNFYGLFFTRSKVPCRDMNDSIGINIETDLDCLLSQNSLICATNSTRTCVLCQGFWNGLRPRGLGEQPHPQGAQKRSEGVRGRELASASGGGTGTVPPGRGSGQTDIDEVIEYLQFKLKKMKIYP